LELIANPKSMTVFESGDRVGIIGEIEHIDAVRLLALGDILESETLPKQ
jgi:K+/H+ antiporter YhaU regulatory subunit KhtT